jgi:hypothetical protein
VLVQAVARGRTVSNDPEVLLAVRQVTAALRRLPHVATDVRSPGSPGAGLTFATVPDHVRVSDQLGSVTLVLPPGATTYRVRAHAGFGGTSIRVPTSSSSSHVIVVTDSSGSIEVTSAISPR